MRSPSSVVVINQQPGPEALWAQPSCKMGCRAAHPGRPGQATARRMKLHETPPAKLSSGAPKPRTGQDKTWQRAAQGCPLVTAAAGPAPCAAGAGSSSLSVWARGGRTGPAPARKRKTSTTARAVEPLILEPVPPGQNETRVAHLRHCRSRSGREPTARLPPSADAASYGWGPLPRPVHVWYSWVDPAGHRALGHL